MVMAMAARELTYTVVLRAEPEGGYTILVPAIPGVVSYGEDIEHARAMAKEAIELMLEHYVEHGEPVPVEDIDSVLTIDEEELTGPITLIRVRARVEEVAVA